MMIVLMDGAVDGKISVAKCTLGESTLRPDLRPDHGELLEPDPAAVVRAWPNLAANIKQAIVALVR